MEKVNIVEQMQTYKLLVVDDEEYALEGIMRTIDWTSLGITDVYGADCVQSAQVIMKHHAPEIIICDIEMAQESGIDFLRWLHDGGFKCRLLFLTAHARFDYAKEALSLGAFDYFLKPVEHGVLKEGVERALIDLQKELSLYDKLSEYEAFLKEWEALGNSKTNIRKIDERPLENINEPDLIRTVKNYIDENIGAELTRDSIAEAVGVNASYLSRAFHKTTGEKLSAYIFNARIKMSMDLLKRTDYKISYIAGRVGYGNDSYFIKVFRNMADMTPYEYRKMFRQDADYEV